MKEIKINSDYTQEISVEESMLASRIGSGVVDVYATPMMIALMENTAMKCLAPFLDEKETSVGILMNATHDAPTPLGMKVTVHAEISNVDRKKITFSIIAKDEVEVIGKATHERFIVDQDRFIQKAEQKR